MFMYDVLKYVSAAEVYCINECSSICMDESSMIVCCSQLELDMLLLARQWMLANIYIAIYLGIKASAVRWVVGAMQIQISSQLMIPG